MRRFDGYMKGVNLGGWLSQYIEKSKEYFDTFIVEDDIKRIKAAGFDHIRLPMDYDIIETENGEPKDDGMKYVDNCIEWCKSAGLNVVLDLHKTFGYSFDPLDKDGDKEIFFYNRPYQERFFQLWDRLSKRYADYSYMVSFELLNEIVSYDVADAWNDIATECSKIIRANAPDSYIIFGGVCYNSVIGVPLLSKPIDDKIVYNFHCYEPLIFTHQRAYWVNNMPDDLVVEYPGTIDEYREKSKLLDADLAAGIMKNDIKEIGPDYFDSLFKQAVDAAEANDVPLYCGEYGVIDLAPVDSKKRWYDDIHSIFDKYGIGRAVWNYKEKDYGKSFEECFMN